MAILSNALESVRNMGTLGMALTVSLMAHAALLTVRFVDPERFNRVFQDTPLEVILVNAKSNEKPDKAQAIAQASLAGGGDADKGRATTPLPLSALTEVGDSHEEVQKKVEALQQEQMMLLANVKKQLAALPPPDPKQSSPSEQAQAQEEKRRQLLRLLAEIEKRINEENARPKKRFISPATREEVYAVYYDQLRRKIEDKGTQNFPEAAGNKLYGELVISITVNYTGSVLETRVEEGSGITALDRRAEAIAKSAGPFGRFTEDMRRRADQIVVISRFKFTREDTLETKLTTR
jgi:periplasmic protein TonB